MTNLKNKRAIVVIGGAGFIGSNLTPLLVEAGHDVTVFDKKDPPPAGDGIRYRQGDIRAREDLRTAMTGADVVINLAAEHRDDVRPLSLYTDVNVTGSANVCAVATELGVTHMIFTSSVAIYGTQDVAMDESAARDFFNEYGRTKHLAEAEYENWLASGPDNQLTIIRPTVVFGPGNKGNVYNLLRQLKYGPFMMFGDGENVKSLAHVDNVAAFIAFLIDRPERHGVYNYADKPDLNMKDLVRFVDRRLSRKDAYRRGLPRWLGVAGGSIADAAAVILRRPLPVSAVRVRKFCSRSEINSGRALSTGFTPPRDLPAGLEDMIDHHV